MITPISAPFGVCPIDVTPLAPKPTINRINAVEEVGSQPDLKYKAEEDYPHPCPDQLVGMPLELHDVFCSIHGAPNTLASHFKEPIPEDVAAFVAAFDAAYATYNDAEGFDKFCAKLSRILLVGLPPNSCLFFVEGDVYEAHHDLHVYFGEEPIEEAIPYPGIGASYFKLDL